MSGGPLAGLKVIDCASYVAAPGAATLLGDFGADVIKIEPVQGDAHRFSYLGTGVPASAPNHFWMLAARNKRSLAIDLKQLEGLDILHRLLAEADVFITNFPHAVRQRLGIGHEELGPKYPRLIYASFTAHGENGPERDRPGFDATSYWTRSGLMDLMRADADAQPVAPTGGLGDNPAAVMLYAGITTALYRRETTGKGGLVTASLLGSGFWTNSLPIQMQLCGAPLPTRVSREKAARACINTYRCRDGRWINMMVLNEEKLFAPLVRVLGIPQVLDDPRFSTKAARMDNAAELIALFDKAFAGRDQAAWTRLLEDAGIMFGPVSTLDDVVNDAQASLNGVLVPFADDPEQLTVSAPFDLDDNARQQPRRAPELGEHTEDIIRHLGLSDDEINDLRMKNVI